MKEPNYQVIGKRVKQFREKKSYTQQKLADATNLSDTHISNIETAKTKVSLPALINIANALDTTVDDLIYTNYDCAAGMVQEEIEEYLGDCTKEQQEIIITTIKALKEALKSYPQEEI